MFLEVPRGSRRRLGTFWRPLGASWGRLGASWGRLGASWGRLGGVLGPPGAVFGGSWAVRGEPWAALGRLGPQSAPNRTGLLDTSALAALLQARWSLGVLQQFLITVYALSYY